MPSLLPCVEIDQDNAAHAIIWLHGLGADGHDFEPVVDELNVALPIRFIFPHAPERPVTINNGMRMPAWYDISTNQIDQRQDETGIRQSQQSLIALIEREIARGVKSHNIILAGFSQGGAIALHTGLRYDKPLAGIMGLSTYLPLLDTVESEMNEANSGTPVLLTHGTHDQVIPVQLAATTQACLQQLNYPVELKTYAMEHSVCPEEIEDISNWINDQFNA